MGTYDKFPSTKIEDGRLIKGWDNILTELTTDRRGNITAVECYSGIYSKDLIQIFKTLPHAIFIDTTELFKSEEEIVAMTSPFLKDDVLFGYFSNLSLSDYFDRDKLRKAQQEIIASDPKSRVIVFGPGSSAVVDTGLLVYADMPRWEIQRRMRRQEVSALGVDNRQDPFSLQYKRGMFNDWKVLDREKKKIMHKVNYWLDTVMEEPKLIDRNTFVKGIEKTAHKPFRVVPFFDPAPWGGQWMKEVCDLDRSVDNFGWCFDCVPEENSLLFTIDGVNFEMPSVNLIYMKSREVLGEPVEARFGQDFPIRFDLLDTMQGGNLSLQVHPYLDYARENFGLHYTQEESYYVLDANEDATVYMGVKTNIDSQAMMTELRKAEKDETTPFDAAKYINILPAAKHDHYLIPAGTIHCSGKNSLVLEISATPNLYTFKLWDWGRLGLDGKPRPINIDRGEKVIRWERDTSYVTDELVNRFEQVSSGDGWIEERTGLHETQFIETRRHTFTKAVTHDTGSSVNVLNLVEGEEVIVESPQGAFEPFIVHYAETFIVPASVGGYSIRPFGRSAGKKCMTIKATVRH